jgi:AMP nucleosidase
VHARRIYDSATQFLRDAVRRFIAGDDPGTRMRGHYPYVRLRTHTAARADSRLSYGFVAGPGVHETTLTRPELFADYDLEQLRLLRENHGVPFEVGTSHQAIPVHFAFTSDEHLEATLPAARRALMRERFDLVDLAAMDDAIANGTHELEPAQAQPLALFTAARVDYSLHRLRHYTGTSPRFFQHFVLFTNYQFYIDEFVRMGHALMRGDTVRDDGYAAFVEPGDIVTPRGTAIGSPAPAGRLPQMPAYHLMREDGSGVTMINIGVGPANAKTITDHVAVLRPHAWIMLGHCAGQRTTQELGDYVLAHGYVREDHVLDEDLPPWVPIPPLAEVQIALQTAVTDVTRLEGYELKRVMRTGTVASTDNRDWELLPQQTPVRRFSQSRAIALDMESATIAANGFRFRIPYGTLLCVSDKPLHGEIKLPGMADAFYRERVSQHLRIGLRAMDLLRRLPPEQLHSRKLRSFAEVAFR